VTALQRTHILEEAEDRAPRAPATLLAEGPLDVLVDSSVRAMVILRYSVLRLVMVVNLFKWGAGVEWAVVGS